MLVEPEDIRIEILLHDLKFDILIADLISNVESNGGKCSVHTIDREKSNINSIVVIDARLSIPSLVNIASNQPLVALVDRTLSIDGIAQLPEVDEVISVAEVNQPLLIYRLQRLASRYKNPLSSRTRRSPELDLVSAMVNTTKDQIYVKDLEHRFIFASDKFARSNGMHIDEIIGKDDIEIGSNPIDVHGSPELGWMGFWAQDDEAVNSGVTTQEVNPEWRAVVEQTRENQVTRVPLKNHLGEVYALLVVSSDITNKEVNTVDLKARGAVLDRAFGAMKKAQESRAVAERAVMEKNKLLAAASHDLRQPLHAMGLFLDVLDRRISGVREKELIEKIKRSSDALSSLFNSLLDISRLDAGVVDVKKEHFAIETLLGGLRSEFDEIALQKNIEIDIEVCLLSVYTDPILLERILRNLIQNAISYTEQGGVKVACAAQSENVDILVEDTGPGIAADEQDQIFSEYYQIENSRDSRTKGLGLGLAIVRRLAKLLDVDVTVSSELGRGSAFSVSVAKGIVEPKATANTREIASALQGQIIVVIDDDRDILDGMASTLAHHHCEIITAESSQKILNILIDRDIVPDAIVADYRLEDGLTGYQAIADIREEFCRDVPAIIVTGDTSADRIKDVARSGCPLLHKPVKSGELLVAISDVLERASSGSTVTSS